MQYWKPVTTSRNNACNLKQSIQAQVNKKNRGGKGGKENTGDTESWAAVALLSLQRNAGLQQPLPSLEPLCRPQPCPRASLSGLAVSQADRFPIPIPTRIPAQSTATEEEEEEEGG